LDSVWDSVIYIVQRCDEQVRELKASLVREEPSPELTTSPSSAIKKRAGESQDGGAPKRSKTMEEFV
jgi:hypothetical protein